MIRFYLLDSLPDCSQPPKKRMFVSDTRASNVTDSLLGTLRYSIIS